MTPNDRYAKIREALEMGPTPGPWNGDDNSVSHLWSNGSVGIREYIALPDSAEDSDPNPADMHWIAACDPDTIRELLAERDRLEARVAELEKALEPFAREAEDWSPEFDDSESIAGETNIKVGHLRAARKFLKENGNGE